MTLVVAWRKGPVVHLVADSLLTFSAAHKDDKPASSVFGETLGTQPTGKVLSDTGFKLQDWGLFQAAYAGTVSRANSFISDVFKEVGRGATVSDAIQTTSVNAAGAGPLDIFVLFTWVDNGVRLGCFDGRTQSFREITTDTVLVIGTGAELAKDHLEREVMRYPDCGDERQLVLLITSLQLRILADSHFLGSGVGGTVWGCTVTHDGVSWMPNMLYLLDQAPLTPVAVAVRENHQVVMSIRDKVGRLGALSKSTTTDWPAVDRAAHATITRSLESRFVTILNPAHRRAIVLERNSCGDHQDARISNVPGKTGVEVSDRVFEEIRNKSTELAVRMITALERDGSIPMDRSELLPHLHPSECQHSELLMNTLRLRWQECDYYVTMECSHALAVVLDDDKGFVAEPCLFVEGRLTIDTKEPLDCAAIIPARMIIGATMGGPVKPRENNGPQFVLVPKRASEQNIAFDELRSLIRQCKRPVTEPNDPSGHVDMGTRAP